MHVSDIIHPYNCESVPEHLFRLPWHDPRVLIITESIRRLPKSTEGCQLVTCICRMMNF